MRPITYTCECGQTKLTVTHGLEFMAGHPLAVCPACKTAISHLRAVDGEPVTAPVRVSVDELAAKVRELIFNASNHYDLCPFFTNPKANCRCRLADLWSAGQLLITQAAGLEAERDTLRKQNERLIGEKVNAISELAGMTLDTLVERADAAERERDELREALDAALEMARLYRAERDVQAAELERLKGSLTEWADQLDAWANEGEAVADTYPRHDDAGVSYLRQANRYRGTAKNVRAILAAAVPDDPPGQPGDAGAEKETP